ncbi:hypothetical protein [Desulfovibrio sp. ZJ200]|nr:hypothetical protein [Desulfovibrio sp. ZJ200]
MNSRRSGGPARAALALTGLPHEMRLPCCLERLSNLAQGPLFG